MQRISQRLLALTLILILTLTALPAQARVTVREEDLIAHVSLFSDPAASVEIVTLGTVTSQILVGGQAREVPTSDLCFGENVPMEKRVAAVDATRTGQATMHSVKSVKDYTVMYKVPCGTLVGVVKAGPKYTRIVYKGKVGYVLSAALTYLSPASVPLGRGIITLKGRATGRTEINIRGNSSANSRIITAWKTASEVLVWDKQKDFYEVEYQGMRGWVQEKFITCPFEETAEVNQPVIE